MPVKAQNWLKTQSVRRPALGDTSRSVQVAGAPVAYSGLAEVSLSSG